LIPSIFASALGALAFAAAPALAGSPPTIANEQASDVSATEAIVSAEIDPGGEPTDYHVEYGGSSPEVGLSASPVPVAVQERLTGLKPGTEYHYHFVAHNERGSVAGAEATFTTTVSRVSSSVLPDNRVYEPVSLALDANGEVYPPEGNTHETYTDYPVRAAADGSAIAYAGEAPATSGSGSTGSGGGDVFIAARGVSGWGPVDATPPIEGARSIYQGYSSDLSLSFLTEFSQPLTPEAPFPCGVLYSRGTADGAYHPAFTTTETPEKELACGAPQFQGVSADDSSVIFQSGARLTPEAVENEAGQRNLYDSVNGHVHLVSILPGGKSEANAAFGGAGGPGEAINADGSRIVWTALNSGDLYVRKDPASPSATTALVAEGGLFRGASSDGSKIFFTKGGDLYEYDVNAAATSDLAPSGSVLGVLGNSQDASFVYFVAESVLASNENAHGEKAGPGLPNLYVDQRGETRFVATLSAEDGGSWEAALQARTAEVTPGGHAVVFVSRRNLTSYSNNGVKEVYTYDADTQQLSCASCNPTGAPPVAAGGKLSTPPTGEQEIPSSYQLRVISDDGSRVFFESTEPLVPYATNGIREVYEWERAGAGACHEQRGCLYSISMGLGNEAGGLTSEGAVFLDADASGDNVFFTTRAQLVPEDRNELVDVYDARAGGGFPHFTTECTGTGCQGAPSPPPIFATPSSVTFNGVGNFSPIPAVAPKKVTRKTTRCSKGKKLKRGKCVREKTRAKKARKFSAHSTKGRK
jgi:hypothetical protein